MWEENWNRSPEETNGIKAKTNEKTTTTYGTQAGIKCKLHS